MKPQFAFTKDKFLSLDVPKQHKKCAELLRIFHGAIAVSEREVLAQQYKSLCAWMGLAVADLLQMTHKWVSDHYHWHLAQAGISIREQSFLLPTTTDRQEASPFLPITIYLDHLRSCHNIGSIIRTTEAFRLGSVAFSDGMADSTHQQVQNTSMETVNWVSCYRIGSFLELPRPIIALETVPESVSYYDFPFPDSFTLAVGNEEYGCSDELLACADHVIHIPLHGRKNSLNVATAFAIVAAEISHKRRSGFKSPSSSTT